MLRTISCNAEVIQIHVCTLLLSAEDTRSDLPRPAVPHDDVLKVGGKVDQASNLRKLVGRWVGQKQFRTESLHALRKNYQLVRVQPSRPSAGDNHAEERIPWPMGPTEHSLQDKLDYSSESRIRWLPTGVIRGFLRVRVPLREIKA